MSSESEAAREQIHAEFAAQYSVTRTVEKSRRRWRNLAIVRVGGRSLAFVAEDWDGFSDERQITAILEALQMSSKSTRTKGDGRVGHPQ